MASVIASAPARVNIIGEHTDYNDGFVLPTCTALYTRVSARRRGDRNINVRSITINENATFDLDRLQPGGGSGWLEYLKGVAAGLQGAGVELQGADIEIDSTIPLGAGLSSSASLELSVAHALLGVAGASLDAAKLALICQQAERDYAGVHCGIMDQYALACAEFGNALLLDCRSLQTKQVALPDDLAFFLTDSGVRHRLSDGDYNNRAAECAAAVKVLAKTGRGLNSLRDANHKMLLANKAELGATLYRRCRHVLSENDRVMSLVKALESGELPQVGEILSASHNSLRDDFEVSCAELDTLVDIANRNSAVLGSRMVGAGFGGCVLSACRTTDVNEAAARVGADYAESSGRQPLQHIVQAAQPARLDSSE